MPRKVASQIRLGVTFCSGPRPAKTCLRRSNCRALFRRAGRLDCLVVSPQSDVGGFDVGVVVVGVRAELANRIFLMIMAVY